MKYSLEIVVFLCGVCTMILELVGSRILAPFVGTSIVVWTSLIGIILASLSVGYFIGGKLSDKHPEAEVLSKTIFIASLYVGFITAERFLIFDLLQNTDWDLAAKAVISAGFLFIVPSILLGIVSPFAARLKTDSVKKVGGTVGNLYAISTVGSIFGTFAAGFYLIAVFTISEILIGLSIVLFLSSLFLTRISPKKLMTCLLLFVGVIFLSIVLENELQNPNVLTKDSLYNSISIYDTTKDKQPIRVMSLDGKLDSAMYLNSDDLVFDYTKFYRLVYTYNPNLKKILVIGGAGYSVPKDFLNKSVAVDVVEIDPELTHLAALYFKLPQNPYLHIYHEDGRTFLNKAFEASLQPANSQPKYDAIMLDAFKSYNIPFQLTTTEAIQKMKSLLTPNGVLLANIISSAQGESGEFLEAERSTFAKSFPVVDTYLVNNPSKLNEVQNVMLIGASNPHLTNVNAELTGYLSHIATSSAQQTTVLTDDFAPVDQMMIKTIL